MSSQVRICGLCGSLNLVWKSECRECGANIKDAELVDARDLSDEVRERKRIDLPASQAAVAVELVPVDLAETIHCPFCAEEILSAATKCKHCGEWLSGEDREGRGRQESSTGLVALGLIWILSSVVGGFALATEFPSPLDFAVFFASLVQGLTIGLVVIRFARR